MGFVHKFETVPDLGWIELWGPILGPGCFTSHHTLPTGGGTLPG